MEKRNSTPPSFDTLILYASFSERGVNSSDFSPQEGQVVILVIESLNNEAVQKHDSQSANAGSRFSLWMASCISHRGNIIMDIVNLSSAVRLLRGPYRNSLSSTVWPKLALFGTGEYIKRLLVNVAGKRAGRHPNKYQ
jgi:hypothetical protein